MPQRFPARVDVDDFCTVNRRTLLRGLGTAALTATGGLFRVASGRAPCSPPHPSRSVSLPVTRRRTASCSGRRSRRDRSSGAVACRGRRWRSPGPSPPTSACARWHSRARPWPIPNSATRCTSRWAGSSRDATISITSPSAVSAARWAASGRCQPWAPRWPNCAWRCRVPAL